eukprot:COSAG02_NODE_45688_length_355_cov_0.507812_1_plen_36_part_10
MIRILKDLCNLFVLFQGGFRPFQPGSYGMYVRNALA